MTEVWLLWERDDSPVAAFATRGAAEKAALVLVEQARRVYMLNGHEAPMLNRNDCDEFSSFWVREDNVAAIARMEVQS